MSSEQQVMPKIAEPPTDPQRNPAPETIAPRRPNRSASALAALRAGRFKLGAVTTLGTDTIARALGLLATILFIRGMSVNSYAFIVVFLAAGQFVGTSATGGIRMRYLRTEAERVSRGADEELSFFSALFSGTVVIAAVAVVLGLFAAAVGMHVGSTSMGTFLLLAAAFAVAQGATELAIYHHQAHLGFVRAGAINIVRSAILAGVAAAVAFALIRSGVTASACVTIGTLVLAGVVSWRLVRPEDLRWPPHRRFKANAESLWLTIFYIASAGYATVDVFIVAALLSHHDVAAFGAAQRYYAFALGAGPALTAVIRVRTAQKDVVDSPRVQREMLRGWIRRSWLPAVVAVVVLGTAAEIVIPVVDGGRYPTSIPVFQLLLIGVAAYYVMMPGASLLMSQKRYRALAMTVIVSLAINCLGDVMAVRLFDAGIIGIAAIASFTYLGFLTSTVWLALRGAMEGPHMREAEVAR